ncbi:MAG: hypothetical protein NWT02_10130 [Opitutales bacterium]|nr:hypothetical protein [Opitutales bacterium]MDP4644010.1 hypothetical protein [Opitutales bacterium]MDP4777036.1 hypothetical protein [Opitutales bacterium]MDP4882668.1 hypothetical protein [Opitutales bacterium]
MDYLEEVVGKLGFELVNLPTIIEVAYAQTDALPGVIATFLTAAARNLHTILNIPVRIL